MLSRNASNGASCAARRAARDNRPTITALPRDATAPRWRRGRRAWGGRHRRPSIAGCCGALGDPLGGGATLVEFGEPAIVHGAAAQHERLEHDEPGARQGTPGVIEQGGVLVLVVLDGAGVAAAQLVPEIVDADQDAQHVGREGHSVRRPARRQVGHLVAADAAIVEPQAAIRVRRERGRCDEQWVARAQCTGRVRVGHAPVPAGVGDRVALEEDHGAVGWGSGARDCGGGAQEGGTGQCAGGGRDELATRHVVGHSHLPFTLAYTSGWNCASSDHEGGRYWVQTIAVRSAWGSTQKKVEAAPAQRKVPGDPGTVLSESTRTAPPYPKPFLPGGPSAAGPGIGVSP